MPRRCSVTGCRSNYRDKSSAGKYVSCYGFPSDPKTLKKWLDAIGRRNFLPNYDAAVCAKHFDESSFLSEDVYRGADGELKVFRFAKPILKIEAVPSLFLERSVERDREIERTDGCGVNEGVPMPLSTLINGLYHKTGAVLHSCEVLEVGDGKTCMDFVEVEMKDPENEEKPSNLDGSFSDSLDLRITNCGSCKRNGCLTNETVIRDGDGECLKNCDTLCDVSRSNLIGNRGFEKRRCDSAINLKLVHHGERDPDSGRFVKKVKGCGGQNSQNPSYQAADAKLDGAGTAGILIHDGSLRRRTERNREVAIVQKRGNTGILCGVLRAEKDAMSKKENGGISGQDVGNSMATSESRSDSGETNEQVHADPETDLCYADLVSEEKVNKIEKNCGGIRSKDDNSSGIFCDEIGGEKNSENKDTTHGEENGNLAEIGVPLSQNRPSDVSNNDFDAMVDSGKNRGSTRGITKMQKGNGYLVLNGSSSQRGMTNDQDFTVGSNPGFVKSTKKVQSCANNISCKTGSDGNVGGVLENGSRGIVGQEHCNLVLINGNLSPNDGMKSGEVVSVKNVIKIHRGCGDISSKNEFLVSGFGVITKNGSRTIPGHEKGSLIVDANSCSNDDVGSGQVVSLKNLKKTKRDFGETSSGSGFASGSQNEKRAVPAQANLCPNDDVQSEQVVSMKNLNKTQRDFGETRSGSDFGAVTKNERIAIQGQENGDLVLMDANLVPNDDVQLEQMVSTKTLKKTQRDFGGSGFGAIAKNERRAIPGQANLCPNDDVRSEQAISMKNLKKTQRDFGETRSGSDFGAVTKNERIAIQGQENGDLVLMDANLVPNDDVQSEQVVFTKTLKKTIRDFGCTGFGAVTKNERRAIPGQANLCPNDDVLSEQAVSTKNLKNTQRDFGETRSGSDFGAVTKNERIAIQGQENGDLVLMDANLVPIDDVQSEQVVFTKTLKKTQRDFGGSGFGVVTKNERRAIPGQENGNSVLMDANLMPSDGMESVGEPEVKVGGQIRGSAKTGEDEGPSEVQEWEGCAVKEELFRGLGLVPRGVLHDRSVDRRHCVTGPRRNESNRPRTAVFYPPGTAMFDTERFIGEIQRRPAIYDVRSKVYSNRVAKLKYWHEVGQEMYKGWDALDQMERRTLVKELQIKWKSIRDHFMRQLKQNMNGEGPKKKKYVHFDQLQFLTANLGVKRPRHAFKPAKQEPEEEYMELTPELPEERHFSFMTTVGRPDYDEHEVPVAATLLPQQPEDLSYHPKDLSYHHHKELSYHKELEGDRMGNKMFLLSLLPIMERLPDHSNIRARLQMMEVLQTFVAHEDASHRDYYNYHDEKQSCGEVSQQHSTASHSDSDT